MLQPKKIPVIIDTDIGDDVDDAFALCLAMASPEIQILGVTTVFKNTEARARIAAGMLALGGYKTIPVFAGERYPLEPAKVHGRDVDYGELPWTYISRFDNERIADQPALRFLVSTLESAAEPVTIVTLGALTNIAKLILLRPDLKPKIGTLCVMGGAFNCNLGEYNFSCDPKAASVVFGSGLNIKCVGLDVTFKCEVNGQYIERLSASKHECLKALNEMKKQWGNHVFLHDPLALMCVFDDSFVTFEKRNCDIEYGARLANGYVVNLSDFNWKKEAKDNLFVGIDVKAQDFVKACMERILSLK